MNCTDWIHLRNHYSEERMRWGGCEWVRQNFPWLLVGLTRGHHPGSLATAKATWSQCSLTPCFMSETKETWPKSGRMNLYWLKENEEKFLEWERLQRTNTAMLPWQGVCMCAHTRVCMQGKVVNGYYGRNRMETEGNLYWDWSFWSPWRPHQ